MTVGALVGWAVLSVVTSIVAKKALGGRCGRRSEKYPRQGLHGGRDDPSSLRVGIGGRATKKGILLRESGLRYESFGGGHGSGGDLRG